jgi:hypothetical protein
MGNNFKCRACGEEFFEPTYKIAYSAGGIPVYRNKFNQKVTCVKCLSEDIESIAKFDGVPYFAKFGSSSPEVKREILKERSEKQSKSEIDKRESINKRFNQRLGGK